MRRFLLVSGLALLAAVLFGGPAPTQDKDKKADFDPAAFAKMSEPGPEHKLLEPIVGNWTYAYKMWMDPSKPPMESTGKVERKWVMGGRFIKEDYQGDEKENAFAGLGLTGYDKQEKKYTSAWVDNMSSSIMTSKGTADASGKVFTYTGDYYCPLTSKMNKSRDVLTIDGPDKHHMEMYRVMPDGKEMKVMELQFTRVKK